MKKLPFVLAGVLCASTLAFAAPVQVAFADEPEDQTQGQVLDGTTDETQGEVMPIDAGTVDGEPVAEATEQAEAEANQETEAQEEANADQPVQDAQQQTNFSSVQEEIENFIHTDKYLQANSIDKNIMVDSFMQNLYAEGKIQSYYQNSGTFGYITPTGEEGFVDVGTGDDDETYTQEAGIEPRGTSAETPGQAIDAWVIALIVAAVVAAGIVVTVVVARKRGSAFSVDDQAPLANGRHAAHISQNDAEEDEDPDDFGDRTPMQ